VIQAAVPSAAGDQKAVGEDRHQAADGREAARYGESPRPFQAGSRYEFLRVADRKFVLAHRRGSVSSGCDAAAGNLCLRRAPERKSTKESRRAGRSSNEYSIWRQSLMSKGVFPTS
jgi:hypothetical protein